MDKTINIKVGYNMHEKVHVRDLHDDGWLEVTTPTFFIKNFDYTDRIRIENDAIVEIKNNHRKRWTFLLSSRDITPQEVLHCIQDLDVDPVFAFNEQENMMSLSLASSTDENLINERIAFGKKAHKWVTRYYS